MLEGRVFEMSKWHLKGCGYRYFITDLLSQDATEILKFIYFGFYDITYVK